MTDNNNNNSEQQIIIERAKKIRKIIEEKMAEKGFESYRHLARISGVSNTELNAISRGRRQTINPILLYKIASTLDMDYAELFQIAFSQSKIETFAPKEIGLEENITMVPVIGTIRAGQPIYAEENIVGYEPVNPESIKGGKYFFLLVEGDSMKGSGIRSGSFALVRKQEYIESGEIAVVMVDNENATVKRIYFNKETNTITLYPDNPEYDPQTYPANDIRIIGKVVRALIDPNKERNK